MDNFLEYLWGEDEPRLCKYLCNSLFKTGINKTTTRTLQDLAALKVAETIDDYMEILELKGHIPHELVRHCFRALLFLQLRKDHAHVYVRNIRGHVTYDVTSMEQYLTEPIYENYQHRFLYALQTLYRKYPETTSTMCSHSQFYPNCLPCAQIHMEFLYHHPREKHYSHTCYFDRYTQIHSNPVKTVKRRLFE